MYMVSVSSKNLKEVGYDEITKILQIRFVNGTYEYYGVPKIHFNGLITASSPNKYFTEYIKNVYPYSKI